MITYDSDLVYWIWLSEINGVGPVTAKVLLDIFKTPYNIYKAIKSELINIKGIGNMTTEAIFNSKSLLRAEWILEKCAVISEYPPGVKPDAKHFPMRNRLISAWCKKLLVVEAGEKSGSLITAAFAKEQNRQVLVAPNGIYSRESMGTNKLIEEGAKIYLNPSKLLPDHMQNIRISNKKEDIQLTISEDLTPLEKEILSKIKDNPTTLGELLIILKEHKSDVLETISIMELKGQIINLGGILKECPTRNPG